MESNGGSVPKEKQRLIELYGDVDDFSTQELLMEMRACANRARVGNSAEHAAYLLDLAAVRLQEMEGK